MSRLRENAGVRTESSDTVKKLFRGRFSWRGSLAAVKREETVHSCPGPLLILNSSAVMELELAEWKGGSLV